MMAERTIFVGAFSLGLRAHPLQADPLITMAKCRGAGQGHRQTSTTPRSSPDKPPAIGNLGVSLCSGVIPGVAVRTRWSNVVGPRKAHGLLDTSTRRCARWPRGIDAHRARLIGASRRREHLPPGARRSMMEQMTARAAVRHDVAHGMMVAETASSLHDRPRRALRHDRHPHGGPVRHLRNIIHGPWCSGRFHFHVPSKPLKRVYFTTPVGIEGTWRPRCGGVIGQAPRSIVNSVLLGFEERRRDASLIPA